MISLRGMFETTTYILSSKQNMTILLSDLMAYQKTEMILTIHADSVKSWVPCILGYSILVWSVLWLYPHFGECSRSSIQFHLIQIHINFA